MLGRIDDGTREVRGSVLSQSTHVEVAVDSGLYDRFIRSVIGSVYVGYSYC